MFYLLIKYIMVLISLDVTNISPSIPPRNLLFLLFKDTWTKYYTLSVLLFFKHVKCMKSAIISLHGWDGVWAKNGFLKYR